MRWVPEGTPGTHPELPSPATAGGSFLSGPPRATVRVALQAPPPRRYSSWWMRAS